MKIDLITTLAWAAGLLIATIAMIMLITTLALGAARTPSSDLGALPGQIADIPPDMLANYAHAGQQFHIDWAIIAAIGKIESNHNRSTANGVHSGVNFAGCCAGAMQISLAGGTSSTWHRYKIDGNNDGITNIYDPADAVHSAARYLTASGAPGNYGQAIFAYNHAEWYVKDVLDIAASYRALTTTPPTSIGAWQVAANPRITLSPSQRSDIAQGLIDPRVITILGWIAQSHTLYVSALKSDHSTNTSNGSVSNHSAGRAVDIAIIDGRACTGTVAGTCGQLAIQLATITGHLHLTELIYCFDPDGARSSDAFAQSDHCDHIHAGYDH